MKSLTIRRRILISFAAILAVMSAMAGASYLWFLQTEREVIEVETKTVPSLYYSAQLMALWANTTGLAREHARADNPTAKKQTSDAVLANRGRLRELIKSYESVITTETDRRNHALAAQLLTQYERAEDAVLAIGKDVTTPLPDQSAAVRNDLDPIAAKMRDALREMVDFNKAEADNSTRQIVGIVRSAELGLVVCFAIALALAILCGILLFRAVTVPLGKLLGIVDHMRRGDFSERLTLARRDEFSTLADGANAMADDLAALIGQIQKSSIQVNTSITEVAATSKEQQATANEIAATTTEIGATAKEISATSNELAHTMDEVSAVAEQTATLANGGQAGLARMESTMRQVMEAAGAINAKLAILSEKAGNINQVVTTITKVADQTNLLSLNAAIEAEKAGQYGRGFAVVATEIRRLADQTAVSTYDIEQMVKDIQSAVAAGVMGMDKFSEEVRRGMQEVQQVGGQLSEIIEQVQGLVPRFEGANEGMQAQATGAGQISEALSQLSEAAQQTVESLQQSTLAIDELNQVSNGLRSSISRFKLRA
ncbi:methyl-accepting chemotaxis protein [Bosea sp. ANAM02]|uniref:methyl-accepting chemotaxis protein n=1 Tax=Bosea sp. ANAM02 TaxID=2020412 RepID=UPI00140EF919|nr:methyl-accepting chemotaxis protein [Bosea sp. ANAM02]BCB18990.1 methyl-accepting chemotaxis protein [Bosea sp. ANAM02]